MKNILLFIGLSTLCMCASANDFNALSEVYKNQATVIRHTQQENQVLTMAMINDVRKNNVIKMPFYEEKFEVVPVNMTETPQQITNIYLPPEKPTLWDNIKSTVPDLLVKSIFLAL